MGLLYNCFRRVDVERGERNVSLGGHSSPEAYFTRVGAGEFAATEHVGGGWVPEEQHVAPALGLLAHCVEIDRDERRDDALQIARLGYDILGTIPISVVAVEIEVVRPGRTIELVEARLSHAGRVALVLRAWLMESYETSNFSGTSLPRIEPPDRMERWDPATIWPGGFVRTAEVRRRQSEPGRAVFWIRTALPLIDGEDVSSTARIVGLLDLANGMTPRASSEDLVFPNVDLTAHLFEQPQGKWLGFDTTVSMGPHGIGLTESVLHDENGPIGTLSQCLTIRPRD